MYWWSIQNMTDNLVRNTYTKTNTLFFWLLNITLTMCQSLIYTSLLFSFLIVEYHFKDWLPKHHEMLDTYHALSWVLSLLNMVIAVSAISWLYYRHRKCGGTKFWQKFSAVNSSVGFHVLVYSSALLMIFLSVFYIIIHIKIEVFKGTLMSTESPWSFLSRLFTNPFGVKAVAEPVSKGFFGSILTLAGTLISLPFLPARITLFLEELRAFIMQFYPILAVIPTLLLLTQYSIVIRWFRYMNNQICQNNLPK